MFKFLTFNLNVVMFIKNIMLYSVAITTIVIFKRVLPDIIINCDQCNTFSNLS